MDEGGSDEVGLREAENKKIPRASAHGKFIMEAQVAFVIFTLAALIIIWTYNSFIRLINRTKEAWADIDVQLKRKYDLIPKLTDLVQSYAKHEKSIFEEVTEARSKALSAQTITVKDSMDDAVRLSLGKVLAIAENYPNLRASENFAKLQGELTETENLIAYARRFYNGNVRDLNTKIEIFPSNILAKIYNFKKWDFFQLDQESA